MLGALPSPVLHLAPDSIASLGDLDATSLSDLWAVFTKCKDSLQDGRRLENLSWRLWFDSGRREAKLHQDHMSTTLSSSSYNQHDNCSDYTGPHPDWSDPEWSETTDDDSELEQHNQQSAVRRRPSTLSSKSATNPLQSDRPQLGPRGLSTSTTKSDRRMSATLTGGSLQRIITGLTTLPAITAPSKARSCVDVPAPSAQDPSNHVTVPSPKLAARGASAPDVNTIPLVSPVLPGPKTTTHSSAATPTNRLPPNAAPQLHAPPPVASSSRLPQQKPSSPSPSQATPTQASALRSPQLSRQLSQGQRSNSARSVASNSSTSSTAPRSSGTAGAGSISLGRKNVITSPTLSSATTAGKPPSRQTTTGGGGVPQPHPAPKGSNAALLRNTQAQAAIAPPLVHRNESQTHLVRTYSSTFNISDSTATLAASFEPKSLVKGFDTSAFDNKPKVGSIAPPPTPAPSAALVLGDSPPRAPSALKNPLATPQAVNNGASAAARPTTGKKIFFISSASPNSDSDDERNHHHRHSPPVRHEPRHHLHPGAMGGKRTTVAASESQPVASGSGTGAGNDGRTGGGNGNGSRNADGEAVASTSSSKVEDEDEDEWDDDDSEEDDEEDEEEDDESSGWGSDYSTESDEQNQQQQQQRQQQQQERERREKEQMFAKRPASVVQMSGGELKRRPPGLLSQLFHPGLMDEGDRRHSTVDVRGVGGSGGGASTAAVAARLQTSRSAGLLAEKHRSKSFLRGAPAGTEMESSSEEEDEDDDDSNDDEAAAGGGARGSREGNGDAQEDRDSDYEDTTSSGGSGQAPTSSMSKRAQMSAALARRQRMLEQAGPIAPPQTPRTTRRAMLATELSESLRRNLLWERQTRNRVLGAPVDPRFRPPPTQPAPVPPAPAGTRAQTASAHLQQPGNAAAGRKQPPSGAATAAAVAAGGLLLMPEGLRAPHPSPATRDSSPIPPSTMVRRHTTGTGLYLAAQTNRLAQARGEGDDSDSSEGEDDEPPSANGEQNVYGSAFTHGLHHHGW